MSDQPIQEYIDGLREIGGTAPGMRSEYVYGIADALEQQQAEIARLQAVVEKIAGKGQDPYIPNDDFAYFDVRQLAIAALEDE